MGAVFLLSAPTPGCLERSNNNNKLKINTLPKRNNFFYFLLTLKCTDPVRIKRWVPPPLPSS